MPLEPDEIERERAYWRSVPRDRPARIEIPGPGQESVWDYPRPPRLEILSRRVEVKAAEVVVARTDRPLRVCETASPPVYYVPRGDLEAELLVPANRESFCEWKGFACYWHVVTAAGVERECVEHAAWSYPEPDEGFEALRDAVAFYPGRVSTCQ